MILVVLAVVMVLAALVVARVIPDTIRREGRGGEERIVVEQSLSWIRNICRAVAGVLALFFILSTSFTIIGADEVGHLQRIYGGGAMPPGQIIAVNRENGPQAELLPPGFHFRLLLKVLYEVERLPVLSIPENQYGLLIARDGLSLREGQFLADGWPEDKFSAMLNAEYFLKNGGQKGPQLAVLRPGKYRLNQYLFEVKMGSATNIDAGEVGVVKSNVQEVRECRPIEHSYEGALSVPLVPKGCIGVWSEPLFPGTYYLNGLAYTVTNISTRVHAWEYKGGYTRRTIDLAVDQKGQITQKERSAEVPVPKDAADPAITTQVEGWLVPLELRVLVQVAPSDSPFVVASVGGIGEIEDRVLTPAIRSVTRNVVGAEGRKVFDLLDKRSELETLVEHMVQPEGRKAGISIKEVRFGDPVIPPELLVARLRQQLADQLQKTYQEEKKAQDERIKTEKARAEADKQPELVTAEIAVKVAEQNKLAAKLRGEGQKLELMEIAAGQKAQVQVLGEERVMELARLEKILDAAVKNSEIVKVPGVLVGSMGGLEGAAAILGASNLGRSISPAAPVNTREAAPQAK